MVTLFRKNARIVAWAGGVIPGLLLLCWLSFRDATPQEYGGRTLDLWLPDLLEADVQRSRAAREAIRAAGPGIVPQLSARLRERRSLWHRVAPRVREIVPRTARSWRMFQAEEPARIVAALKAVSLLGIEASGAAPAVRALLAAGDCDVQSEALRTLASLKRPWDEVRQDLLAALKDRGCSETRAVAAEVLGTVYPSDARSALPALVAALEDRYGQVRAQAANAIGRVGSSASLAIEPLTARLGDELAVVRMSAALALRRIGRAGVMAVAPLTRLLEDEDAGVRREAAKALESIGPEAEAAIPSLMKAMRDEQIYVQISAIEALGGIGPAAGVAVEALKEARNNNQSGVGRQVLAALERIAPSARE